MGENFEIKHTRAERKQTRLIRTGESVHAHGWTMIRPGSGSVKSARNWRGSSDLTSPILTIGAACAISTSLARGPGPLSCKTATQISNPPIRLPFNGNWGWWLWPVGTRNRIESNRCFQPSTPPMQMHPSILFFPPFPFFILHALSFHPSPIDRNILFLLRREGERERYPWLHTPLALSEGRKSWKGVKKGRWRSMLEQVTRTLTADVERSWWRYE